MLKSPIKEMSIENRRSSTLVRWYSRIGVARYAEKLFDGMVSLVDEEIRRDYTINIQYDRCRLLIRPFILQEIVMATGQWEREIKNVLYNEIKSNDVVVDIGAYIGDYTVPLAKRTQKIIAFEPNPQTSKILQRNLELNQIDNIKLIRMAVTSSKEVVEFHLSNKPYISKVIPETNSHEDSSTIEVETIDLDTALLTENRIDWLLIDSEGYEVSVLNGATNILRKHSPKIIIEILPENYNTVKKILMDEGYRFVTQLNPLGYYARKQS